MAWHGGGATLPRGLVLAVLASLCVSGALADWVLSLPNARTSTRTASVGDGSIVVVQPFFRVVGVVSNVTVARYARSGIRLWQVSLWADRNTTMDTPPVAWSDGKVFVAHMAWLVALDGQTGKQLWKVTLPSPVLMSNVMGSFLAVDASVDAVMVGTQSGVVAYGRSDGHQVALYIDVCPYGPETTFMQMVSDGAGALWTNCFVGTSGTATLSKYSAASGALVGRAPYTAWSSYDTVINDVASTDALVVTDAGKVLRVLDGTCNEVLRTHSVNPNDEYEGGRIVSESGQLKVYQVLDDWRDGNGTWGRLDVAKATWDWKVPWPRVLNSISPPILRDSDRVSIFHAVNDVDGTTLVMLDRASGATLRVSKMPLPPGAKPVSQIVESGPIGVFVGVEQDAFRRLSFLVEQDLTRPTKDD